MSATKYEYCRLCAESKSEQDIFDITTHSSLRQEIIAKLTFFNANWIDFSAKDLPETVCQTCYCSLSSCYEFFTKIRISQAVLFNLISANINAKDYHNNRSFKDSSVTVKVEDNLQYESEQEDNGPTLTVPTLNINTDDNDMKLFEQDGKDGWLSYTWVCGHCSMTLQDMETLRAHSRQLHSTCCSHKCVDCGIVVEKFKSFIGHVLEHRDAYRSYCPYCNLKIENVIDHMSLHISEHECLTCGEMFHSNESLRKHQKTYQQITKVNHTVSSKADAIYNYKIQLECKPDLSLIDSEHDNSKNNIDMKEKQKKDSHSNIESDSVNTKDSWSNYTWSCLHCGQTFTTMSDLRSHSKETHDRCFGFNCSDCDEKFNMFNSFIEHVRQHREVLRNYCQYCNKKFDARAECELHALTHWSGSQKICPMCGDICSDAESLNRHRRLFRLVLLPRKFYKKSPRVVVPETEYDGTSNWENYPWTCQECCVRMPDLATLRSHAQQFHGKCFAMKCADCLRVERNYVMFVKHVKRHRPYLKKFCPYCSHTSEDPNILEKHVDEHWTGPQKPCDGCGEIFDNTQLLQHLKTYDPPRHKGTITTEHLTCDSCGKLCKNLNRLRTHRQTHDKTRKPENICDICGKSFYNTYALKEHIKTHVANKNEVCQMCNKVFLTFQKLKSHLKTHVDTKLFTCDQCGKQFKTKKQLQEHVFSHRKILNFECTACGKNFARKTTLKTHMNTHLESSPYACTNCEKTFNSWSNCNKHMIRKHGVYLAKTKLTPQGRIQINKHTGKVISLAPKENLEEWINEVMKKSRRGKNKNSDVMSS